MDENNNLHKKITPCTIKEVQALFSPEPSASWVSKQIGILRDALNKPKPQIVTIEDFKKYFGV